MSPLTKIFIVLQVILSVLLVAGQIVFVNRTEDYKGQVATAKALTQQAQADDAAYKADATAREAELKSVVTAKDSQLLDLRKSLDSVQTQLDTAKTSLGSSQADFDKLTASNDFTSQALKAAQDQNGALQNQYADLRKSADNVEKQNADSTMAIADLRSRLDATERQRRYLAEQNAELATNLQTDNDMIKKAGLTAGQSAPTINPEPTIALNGVIQDTKVIQGVPYGTISLGSADQVSKDMKFIVVDPNSNTFLGYLTVDTVEPHAASGKLEGPHVDDVHAGNTVKTQL